MKTPHRLFTLLSAFVALLSVVHADVSVTVTTGNAAGYATSNGTLLPAGCIIRVGTFDTSGLNLSTLQTSNSFSTVNALFTPLGEGIGGAGVVAESGAPGQQLVVNWSTGTLQVSGQITGISASYLPTGAPLYAWVFNSDNTANATEWGIFAAPAYWTFPTEFTTNTMATRRTSDIIRGDSTGAVNLSTSQLQLSSIAPVPEPSGALLLSLVGLGAILRRSRRFAS